MPKAVPVVVTFRRSRASDRIEKLSSVRCTMLPSNSSSSHVTLNDKVRQLQRVDPAGAVVIERLVDSLLANAAGSPHPGTG